MLDVVDAKQWDSNSGGLEYHSLPTGMLSLEATLKMVDQIAATPSLDRLGDEYGGSRGWIIVETIDTILHAYIDDTVKVEYFGEEDLVPIETEGAPGLYAFIDLESLKKALRMIDEAQPVADFIRANAVE